MKTDNLLHRISHAKWLFLLAVLFLIFYCFLAMPENLISIIGIIIYLSGIHMGLDSLANIERMTKEELQRFSDERYVKIRSKLILFNLTIITFVSLIFLSLKFFTSERNSVLFQQFFDLGLDCLALMLGLLCLLKNVNDKGEYTKSRQLL